MGFGSNNNQTISCIQKKTAKQKKSNKDKVRAKREKKI